MSFKTEKFVESFKKKYNRNPRILHIGNIANNAYNNALILNSYGITSDVLCYDNYNIFSCPEWEQYDVDPSVVDILNPDWAQYFNTKVNKRPKWFVQGPLRFSIKYLKYKNKNKFKKKEFYWFLLTYYNKTLNIVPIIKFFKLIALILGKYVNTKNFLIKSFKKIKDRIIVVKTKIIQVLKKTKIFKKYKRLPKYIKAPIRIIALFTIPRFLFSLIKKLFENFKTKEIIFELDYAFFISEFNKKFPYRSDKLNKLELTQFNRLIKQFEKLFDDYDLVQAYSTDPIIPYLSRCKNYVCYEHGTLRRIPFEKNVTGRLTSLSYASSKGVFITNCDEENLDSANKLSISKGKKHFLPHAFNYKRLHKHAASRLWERNFSAPYKLLMTCRQHWTDENLSLTKKNDILIRALPYLVEENFPFTLSLIEWGSDIQATKNLISELKVDKYVEWLPVQPKSKLWDLYLDHHLVIDQFALAAISGCGFESLALGCPVLTATNKKLMDDFFGKAPPFLGAKNKREVAEKILELFASKSNYFKRSKESIDWIIEYHSPEKISKIQSKVYESIFN